ncbi:short-chain dehydrogenase/reductase SDR [Pyronema omphalodes]|nr:short-chain dehydrogenase/reductase SDR [Pyronema omphalodes]
MTSTIPTTSSPVWFITGCSSGFGASLAKLVLTRGHRLIATSRTPSKSPSLVSEITSAGGHWLTLDVTSPSAPSVVQTALSIYGHIDYFVNNAGYSLIGAIELFSEAEYRQQMEVNFFAPLRLIQTVLPSMRERKSGCIINISSTAALNGFMAFGMYSASKWALEGMSESLAKEVAEFGIRVVIVEAGAFRSDFLDNFVLSEKGAGGAYEDTALGKHVKTLRQWSGMQPGDVEKGVQRIFEVVTGTGMGEGKEGYLRCPLGSDWADAAQRKIDELVETKTIFEDIWKSTDVEE